MSNISNRFFVTALDDGTTLHGNLSVDGSLSQAWNGSAAVPNWGDGGNTGTAEQPTIMLTLLSGATYIGTDSSSPNGYIDMSKTKWYYNDNGTDSEITFASTTSTITLPDSTTITGYKSTDNKFLKHTKSLNGVTVPCLRVIKNLASDDNVDLDTVTIKGVYNSGSGEIDFQASAQIRISAMSSGSYLGVLTFLNGLSDITESNQSVTISGTLYGSDGNAVSSVKTAWFLNEATFQAKSTTNSITVSESQVVDNALVRCDFYETVDGTDVLRATAYASIDDMQDPEFMYIQYNGANGNAASLRKGQTATFDIWVGKTNDPTPDASYVTYKVKLLDGSGNVITTSYTSAGIQNVISSDPTSPDYGWRPLVYDATTTHKATIPITYTVVNENGKNITGLILASTT